MLINVTTYMPFKIQFPTLFQDHKQNVTETIIIKLHEYGLKCGNSVGGVRKEQANDVLILDLEV